VIVTRRTRIALSAVLALAIVCVWGFDAWLGTCGFAGCPSASAIRALHPSEGGEVLDRNDHLLGHLENIRRVNVPLSAVPRDVRDAFVATEDRRFYEHNGLDWHAFMRALVRNLGAGGVREGFSTITMQVAHNSFLEDRFHGRSFRRKLIELRLARLLERNLTKDQILEQYLNVIYLGNGVSGVEAASRDLFGKSVGQLTLPQAAMLAALPKAPSVYTPRRNPEKARERRNLVLDLMAEQGYVSASQARVAQASPLRIAEDEWRPSLASEPSALDAVRALVDSVLPDVLKDGDVTVYTTLDIRLQKAADAAVVKHTATITRETRDAFGGVSESAQGAIVALDPATGDLRAVVPGRRTQRGGFNRAFDAKRQPGSAFKPFVYAAALAAGYSPATEVDDTPVEVQVGNDIWAPSDYNDEYAGRITLRRALLLSANAATVRVSRAVGETNVIAAARRNGITSPLPNVPSIALGAVEVTPVELARAYAPFANGGYRVTTRLVTRVEAPDGTLLWSMEAAPRVPAMDPREAYEITSMLTAVVDFGTGRTVRDMGITGPIAGKTGTTNDQQDAWFVGYSPTLVAAVWFGYDTPREIGYGATGGRIAAPAWAEMYAQGWREPQGSAFTVPAGMTSAIIDPESGQLATEWCPVRVREWFKPGSEPQEPCQLHGPGSELPGGVDAGAGSDTGRHGNPIDNLGRKISKALRKIFHW
jgi:penicillin-binding protein 1A